MGICNSKQVNKIHNPSEITIPLEYEDRTFTVNLNRALQISTTSKRTIIKSINIYKDANIKMNKYYLKIIYPSEYYMQYAQEGEILFIEFRLQPMDIHIWAEPSFMTRGIPIRKSVKKIRLLTASNIY